MMSKCLGLIDIVRQNRIIVFAKARKVVIKQLHFSLVRLSLQISHLLLCSHHLPLLLRLYTDGSLFLLDLFVVLLRMALYSRDLLLLLAQFEGASGTH